jgi:hypothetical protein
MARSLVTGNYAAGYALAYLTENVFTAGVSRPDKKCREKVFFAMMTV